MDKELLKELKKSVNELFDKNLEELELEKLKIKANALDVRYDDKYIIELRDKTFKNYGKYEAYAEIKYRMLDFLSSFEKE